MQRSLNMIWLAMMFALASYWITVALVWRANPAPRIQPPPLLLNAIWLAAIGKVVAAWWCHGATRDHVERQLNLALAPDDVATVLTRLQNFAVISMALLEAPTVFGVALALGWRLREPFYLLLTLSAAMLMLFRVRALPELAEPMQRVERRLPQRG